ncbi:hypothetical protein HCU64_17615 [Methylobacterium sp. C25]|uniref:hypothetical protein n=1 Tax=Methylobacterium sp. C25 TaxID=2721622 RepID=UPI001F363A9B|nr:hypothetical protein [Methylobacterium sp. C25]MCE4225574.1 hypothetical protein [Methylobacterium sp. C25]
MDSRGPSGMGYVPLDTIVERIVMLFPSVEAAEAEACNAANGRSVGWDRLFTMVH